MLSSCERYIIAFNGEIYNFRQLRTELATGGVVFRTTSDTEVLLALFGRDREAMLPQLRGMFAFVIWDRLERRAFVARDPYGIKPLYYAQMADGVLLASQVKALLATGLVSRAPSARGQAGFWLLGSVPEPWTWYRDIRGLPAGHYAWVEDGRLMPPRQWWDIGATLGAVSRDDFSLSEVQRQVAAALQRTAEAHLVSDVPVGILLSGGVDSTALAALLTDAGARDLHAVTLVFEDFAGRREDEGPVARSVAHHLGLRHHVKTVVRADFLADLGRFLRAMDQPSVDGLNTWYATKSLAELGLKVAVSGIGGDELFDGYTSFIDLPRVVNTWGRLSRAPGMTRVAKYLAAMHGKRSGNHRWDYAADWARTLPGAWWLRRSIFSPRDLPALMGATLAEEALLDFTPLRWTEEMSGRLLGGALQAIRQMESTIYLRNQLLRDSDWASMDHGVELRTPFVDAWLLREVAPALSSVRAVPKKFLLAQAPQRPWSAALSTRPKTGFNIPLGRWLALDTKSSQGYPSRTWAQRVAAAYQEGLPS